MKGFLKEIQCSAQNAILFVDLLKNIFYVELGRGVSFIEI